MNTLKTTTEQRGINRATSRPTGFPGGATGLALLLALSLACSPGGDFAATGGTSGTGISRGSITAFGSIFVNGVEWELAGSSIELDGAPAVDTALRLGMVVRVEGTRSADGQTGDAVTVVFDDSIEGPIENLQDPLLGVCEFEILGVPIVIELGFTHFDDSAIFDELLDLDVVEISGFADELGRIRATRVELKGKYPTVDDVERKGTISGLNPSTSSFLLDSFILVHYDETTTEFDGLAGETGLSVGLFVEVEGPLRSNLTEIDAVKIEREDNGLEDGDEVELEGVVTSFSSLSSFLVEGVEVDASSATLNPSDLFLGNPEGIHIVVEGRFSGSVLIAKQVESEEDENSVRITAAVSSIDFTTRTLDILGVSVHTDGHTELEDESAANASNFRFEDIKVDDWLEILGAEDGTGAVLASDIERDDAGSDVILEGPVTDVQTTAPQALWILGLKVPIHGSTQYRDADGLPLTQGEFFDTNTGVMIDNIGTAVDQGALSRDSLDEADEVSFEID